jgi:hypothetical protein
MRSFILISTKGKKREHRIPPDVCLSPDSSIQYTVLYCTYDVRQWRESRPNVRRISTIQLIGKLNGFGCNIVN